jgi:hypothetical protein
VRTPPTTMIRVLDPFSPLFSKRIWHHVQVLLAGAILAPGKRTVASALRALGLGEERRFCRYHRVLSRASWSSRQAGRVLLELLVEVFVAEGPLILGIDETLERRRGKKIHAKGVYRDPVRSSHEHFVKTSGLRWVCLTLLAPIPWASRVWALPFLSALAYSERYAKEYGKRHKPLTEWAWQLLLQVRRWHPERKIVAVADRTYASLKLLDRCRRLSDPITCHNSLAFGCCPLRTRTATSPRTNGKASAKGRAAAQPFGRRRRSCHRVDTDHGNQLVRKGKAYRGGGLCHRRLVQHRFARGTFALGIDPRSQRRVQDSGSIVHRPRGEARMGNLLVR